MVPTWTFQAALSLAKEEAGGEKLERRLQEIGSMYYWMCGKLSNLWNEAFVT